MATSKQSVLSILVMIVVVGAGIFAREQSKQKLERDRSTVVAAAQKALDDTHSQIEVSADNSTLIIDYVSQSKETINAEDIHNRVSSPRWESLLCPEFQAVSIAVGPPTAYSIVAKRNLACPNGN